MNGIHCQPDSVLNRIGPRPRLIVGESIAITRLISKSAGCWMPNDNMIIYPKMRLPASCAQRYERSLLWTPRAQRTKSQKQNGWNLWAKIYAKRSSRQTCNASYTTSCVTAWPLLENLRTFAWYVQKRARWESRTARSQNEVGANPMYIVEYSVFRTDVEIPQACYTSSATSQNFVWLLCVSTECDCFVWLLCVTASVDFSGWRLYVLLLCEPFLLDSLIKTSV
jgi:hypothetical protein